MPKTQTTCRSDDPLQLKCREYLSRLRYIAKKYGLALWMRDILRANKRGECEATHKEVVLLARIVDEERIKREEIPPMLGKSYRKCFEDGDFDKIDRLEDMGTYSKLSAFLLANGREKKKFK